MSEAGNRAYLAELLVNWRPLLAAFLGLATGLSLTGTVTSAIAPDLIADNGWSGAEFAAVGTFAIFTTAVYPFAGWLTDRIGVRYAALIGLIGVPASYLAYGLMDGRLGNYIAIYLVQTVLCVTTTATVYTRLCVQYVHRARGGALAIAVSGTAVSAAILGPVLNAYVEAHGWRQSYQALAAATAMTGIVVFLLIPPSASRRAATPRPVSAGSAWREVLKTRTLWVLVAAMLLCNLPQVIMLTQLKLVLLDNGVSGSGAGVMLSALSIGMLTGRIVTGVALDRFNPYVAAFASLGLPSLGLFVIASGYDAPTVLLIAVFFLGFTFGAEGDVVGFLVGRHFPVEVYSSVMGILVAAMSVSASAGAALLGVTLAWTGGFDLFLRIAGTSVFIGASLLFLLGKRQIERPASGRSCRAEGG